MKSPTKAHLKRPSSRKIKDDKERKMEGKKRDETNQPEKKKEDEREERQREKQALSKLQLLQKGNICHS